MCKASWSSNKLTAQQTQHIIAVLYIGLTHALSTKVGQRVVKPELVLIDD